MNPLLWRVGRLGGYETRGRIFSLRSAGAFAAAAIAADAASSPSIRDIALFFLRVGAVLYGGGYVLLAFLEQGLVQQHMWLTRQQLLDAVAMANSLQGRFFRRQRSSVTSSVVYLAPQLRHGGIFLPSFFYVALLAPVLFRLRKSAWIADFLDSVNACAISLMAGVTVQVGSDALRGWVSWGIALISLGVLLRWKVSAAWNRACRWNRRIAAGPVALTGDTLPVEI